MKRKIDKVLRLPHITKGLPKRRNCKYLDACPYWELSDVIYEIYLRLDQELLYEG